MRLEFLRWLCLLLTGALLSAGPILSAAGAVVLLSVVGFLASFVAVGVAPHARRDEDGAEPPWWPRFEREFRHHVHTLSDSRDA